MRKSLHAAEDGLAQIWWILALLAFVAMVSCAYSRFNEAGELETVGTDVIEGVTAGEDVVGAVVDAVKNVDPTEVIEDVRGGDWLSIVALVLGLGSAGVGGYIARKKWRARKEGSTT